MEAFFEPPLLNCNSLGHRQVVSQRLLVPSFPRFESWCPSFVVFCSKAADKVV